LALGVALGFFDFGDLAIAHPRLDGSSATHDSFATVDLKTCGNQDLRLGRIGKVVLESF
jgi:hypothetical protein